VAPHVAHERGERPGLPHRRVDAVDEDVLEGQAAPGRGAVPAARLEQLGERVLAVDRHEVVA
jgi:hypothetical protein